jgi:hypothetical protein
MNEDQSDNNPSLLREFADFRYSAGHYGIVGDCSLKDVCLSSAAEIDDLRKKLATAEAERDTLRGLVHCEVGTSDGAGRH